MTLQAFWREAWDIVLCEACLVAAEASIIKEMDTVDLPTDADPIARLIEVSDKAYWATNSTRDEWYSAVRVAIAEAGGPSAGVLTRRKAGAAPEEA